MYKRFVITAIMVAIFLLALGLLIRHHSAVEVAADAQADPGMNCWPHFTKVDMISGRVGWGLTGQGVLYTDCGGKKWRDVTPVAAKDLKPEAGYFLDKKTAWVVFAGRDKQTVLVFSTNDGGKSWADARITTREPDPFPGPLALNFIDNQRGWMLLSYGVAAGSEKVELFATADGGKTWQAISSSDNRTQLPPKGLKNGVVFQSPCLGWLTGVWYGDRVFLYRSRDGGKHWHSVGLELPEGYISKGGAAETLPPAIFKGKGILPVSFHGSKQAMIFYRIDKGGQLTSTTPLHYKEGTNLIYSIVNRKQIIAFDGTSFYVTSDGAKKWSKRFPKAGIPGLVQIDFVSSRKGFALSRNGMLWKTVDGGYKWSLIPSMPRER